MNLISHPPAEYDSNWRPRVPRKDNPKQVGVRVAFRKQTGGANMKRKPKISALGYMMLIVPCEQGDGHRIEFFRESGNWTGFNFCINKAEAISRRRYLYRLHERIARERRERAAAKAAEGK